MFILIGLFYLFLPWHENKHGIRDLVKAIALSTFFLLLGGLPFFYHKNHYLRFNESFIEVRSVSGRITSLQWSEITSWRYRSFLGEYEIITRSGSFRVHGDLAGLQTFESMFTAKTQMILKVPES